jgi:deoxyribodipyrimidine photo-lyase
LRCAENSLDELLSLARECGANRVLWNRRYEPAIVARDRQIKLTLRASGLATASYNSALLFEPWAVSTKSGGPFQVFTPYWRACLTQAEPAAPLPAPARLRAPRTWPDAWRLEDLALLPRVDWAAGLRRAWVPGSHGARSRLDAFLGESLRSYAQSRNRPDAAGTSRLSPHLHFGELGPREIWHAARETGLANGGDLSWRRSQFITELGWREFAHHLLFHFPQTPEAPLRGNFARFPWRRDARLLAAWQRGNTGYPIVDAGLRELWNTGWMHNRVRMIAASFLVKDLLISWAEGAAWFWDTLVDADLAGNTLGWQWVSGCGADAAPYFRVFNPVLQGVKFDPEGAYVRRWVPELQNLTNEWIHEPWQAPADVLTAAGVRLGENYPSPLVDHTAARSAALEALATLKED